MKLSEQAVHARLSKAGIAVISQREIAHAKQLRLANGGIINLFTNGTVQVQGTAKTAVEGILMVESLPITPPAPQSSPNVINQNKTIHEPEIFLTTPETFASLGVSIEPPLGNRRPDWTDDPTDDGTPPF
jgi:hypothetical protein